MKKIIVLVFVLLSTFSFSQDKFEEGVIMSKQNMSSDNEQVNAQLASMGKDVMTTIYVKGDKSRTEVSNPMTGDIVTVTDMASKEMLMLMDSPMLGKKYILQKLELTDDMLENINIVEGTDKKTVLGYECKQHTVTTSQNGIEMKMVMYITDKISPVISQQTAMLGDKLKGFPMYMEITMNQMGSEILVTSEVTKLEKKSVSDAKFNLAPPEGYEKMD